LSGEEFPGKELSWNWLQKEKVMIELSQNPVAYGKGYTIHECYKLKKK
jgi:hypothetical protein